MASPAPPIEPTPETKPARPAPRSGSRLRRVRRSVWFWAAWIALGAASIAAIGWRRGQGRLSDWKEEPARTARARLGELQQTVRISGTVAARQYASMSAPRLRGRLGSSQLILVKLAPAGGRVKKGEVVAEFDRQWQLQAIEDQEATVAQSEASLAKRRAELRLARQSAMQSLSAAKAQMDKARLDLKTAEVRSEIEAEKLKLLAEEAEARHKQLAAEIPLLEASQNAELRRLEIQRDRTELDRKRAEVNVEKMVMRTPIDGVVVMQATFRGAQAGQVQEGDQIGPGSYFMQVVNPEVMVVHALANQAESQLFRLGQKAEIRVDAYPGQVWPGRLIGLGAMAGGTGFMTRGGARPLWVRHIPVRFAIQANDARILPDLSASATTVLAAERGVIIPLEAIEKETSGSYARVRGSDGSWQRRRVELGMANNTEMVVRAGVQAGEELALALAAPH